MKTTSVIAAKERVMMDPLGCDNGLKAYEGKAVIHGQILCSHVLFTNTEFVVSGFNREEVVIHLHKVKGPLGPVLHF